MIETTWWWHPCATYFRILESTIDYIFFQKSPRRSCDFHPCILEIMHFTGIKTFSQALSWNSVIRIVLVTILRNRREEKEQQVSSLYFDATGCGQLSFFLKNKCNTCIDQDRKALVSNSKGIWSLLLWTPLCSTNRSGTSMKTSSIVCYKMMSSRTEELAIFLCAMGLHLHSVSTRILHLRLFSCSRNPLLLECPCGLVSWF